MAGKEINTANISAAMNKELTERRQDAKEKFVELQGATKCLTEQSAAGCGKLDRVLSSVPEIVGLPFDDQSKEGLMAEAGLSTLECIDSTRQLVKSNNEDLILSGLTIASLGVGSLAVRGTGAFYKAATALKPGMSMAQRANQFKSTIQSAKALASTKAGQALIATYGMDAAFFGDSAGLAYEACQTQLEAASELAPTPSTNFQCTTPEHMAFYKKRMSSSNCLMEVGMATLDLLPFVGPAVMSVIRARRANRLPDPLKSPEVQALSRSDRAKANQLYESAKQKLGKEKANKIMKEWIEEMRLCKK